MKKIGIITFIIVLTDRALKLLVNNTLELFVKYEVIDNFFYLLNCHNEGAAFSILEGNIFFLVSVTILALVIIVKFIKAKKTFCKTDTISYGLLLGGIVGNLIDRVVYGYVIDYLGFTMFDYNFPVFNFADIAIVVGAFVIIIKEFRGDKNESENSSK